MNEESERILRAIERKYFEAQTPNDRMIVKWLGWLAMFLSMDTEERIAFAEDDFEVRKTRITFKKDIYGTRKQKVRTTTNTGTIGTSSSRTRSILYKGTSKNRKTS